VRAGGERLKALSSRLLTAHEEERRRLAVELHDDLGQVLTAVKINLQSLQRTLPRSQTDDLAQAIASVDGATERVRDLALALRPSVLDDLGLPAALRWYADRFARDTGIGVHFSIDAVVAIEPPVETVCFRVTQEALTNVARHARAQNVWVDLHAVVAGTELRIRDDGIGFDVLVAHDRAVGGESLGLLGMEERVSLLGGELDVQSAPGIGTEVSARFPGAEKT
jgi:signal transduction histidine kinase